MSVFHLVLAVVWLFVSIAFALLARFKHKLFVDEIIWTDVVSSVLAFIIFIIYVVRIVLEVA